MYVDVDQDWYNVVKVTCIGILAVLGAFFNIVVLVMFYKKPSLRSPSNRFVGSLIASDLLSSTVLGPLFISGMKTINKALIVFVATSTIFSILVIAMDRYTAVLSPLHYATNVTRQKSVLVIGTVWSISAVFASPLLFKELLVKDKCLMVEWTHGVLLLLLVFVVPCAALILVYFKMYVAAHRNSLRTRKHSVCMEPDLSRRNSNAIFSALLFREESRAMKTSMMVLSTYLFSWTPLFVNVSVYGLPDEVVYSCALSAATLNPLVYVFRNDVFRKEMLRVMCNRNMRESTAAKAAGGAYQQHRLMLANQPDSVSVHSFRMSSVECQHSFDSVTPPPADFIATYNPINGSERCTRYESVTFRLAQRRCQYCSRQSSDSSLSSNYPLLNKNRSSSEPNTPKHHNNNDNRMVMFKVSEVEPKRNKLQRMLAIDADCPSTRV